MRPTEILSAVVLALLALWLVWKLLCFVWDLFQIAHALWVWSRLTPEEKARVRAGYLLRKMADTYYGRH